MAAEKAEEFIMGLKNGCASIDREKFSFTWNGEYRIKNCKKVDLVGAYRLVLIQKDYKSILLYIGSHEECFRWLERNKGLSYEVNHSTKGIRVVQHIEEKADALPKDVIEDKKFAERYEQELINKIDDELLSRIFFGLRRNDQD